MLRQMRTAILSVLVMAIVFGLIFPFVITAIAQVAFHHQANGSLITNGGKVIGSEIIGQNFTGPGYFRPRPPPPAAVMMPPIPEPRTLDPRAIS